MTCFLDRCGVWIKGHSLNYAECHLHHHQRYLFVGVTSPGVGAHPPLLLSRLRLRASQDDDKTEISLRPNPVAFRSAATRWRSNGAGQQAQMDKIE